MEMVTKTEEGGIQLPSIRKLLSVTLEFRVCALQYSEVRPPDWALGDQVSRPVSTTGPLHPWSSYFTLSRARKISQGKDRGDPITAL